MREQTRRACWPPQLRHQKVVEVAPSLGLPEDLRRRLTVDALRLCASAGLSSAATVEFLVPLAPRAPVLPYYFLEVNPRIQVEHTVTEELFGVDLVAAQLQIAAGATFASLGDAFARLRRTQPSVQVVRSSIDSQKSNSGSPGTGVAPNLPLAVVAWPAGPDGAPMASSDFGAAIQLRVVMEDLGAGTVLDYRPCAGPGVRVDSALYQGYELPTSYDPLLCKVA